METKKESKKLRTNHSGDIIDTSRSYTEITITKSQNEEDNMEEVVSNETSARLNVHVTSTINNTKAVRTWWNNEKKKIENRVKTGGNRGYKNTQRGSVHAAEELRNRVVKECKEKKRIDKEVHVYREGIGRGRSMVVEERRKGGRKVRSVSDATKQAHNGCRRKKVRRV